VDAGGLHAWLVRCQIKNYTITMSFDGLESSTIIKSRRTTRVARGKSGNAYKILVGKAEGKSRPVKIQV
jgi:hypothetical protein